MIYKNRNSGYFTIYGDLTYQELQETHPFWECLNCEMYISNEVENCCFCGDNKKVPLIISKWKYEGKLLKKFVEAYKFLDDYYNLLSDKQYLEELEELEKFYDA